MAARACGKPLATGIMVMEAAVFAGLWRRACPHSSKPPPPLSLLAYPHSLYQWRVIACARQHLSNEGGPDNRCGGGRRAHSDRPYTKDHTGGDRRLRLASAIGGSLSLLAVAIAEPRLRASQRMSTRLSRIRDMTQSSQWVVSPGEAVNEAVNSISDAVGPGHQSRRSRGIRIAN
jgi:hypothetical protein